MNAQRTDLTMCGVDCTRDAFRDRGDEGPAELPVYSSAFFLLFSSYSYLLFDILSVHNRLSSRCATVILNSVADIFDMSTATSYARPADAVRSSERNYSMNPAGGATA